MNHYDFEMGICPKRPQRKPTQKRHVHLPSGVSPVRRPSGNGSGGGGDIGERYEQAIAAYGSGATWSETITYWGTAVHSREYDLSEMDENAIDDSFIDEIADSIRADVDERGTGVPSNRVGDVRRGVVTALRKMIVRAREWREQGGRAFTPRAMKPKPPPRHAAHVRNLIGGDALEWIAADGGGLHTPGANPEALIELSPCIGFADAPPCEQTAMFMRALFRPDEWVHVLDISDPPPGIKGKNVRTAADWLDVLNREGELPGDGLLPNPLTGELGTTKSGKPSLIADDCVATFPFALIEFDDIQHAFGGNVEKGLAAQYAFWAGFVERSNLAPALVSVTQSGGKSLHGLLHVGAKTREEWERYRAQLAALFMSDQMSVEIERDGKPAKVYPFRCDPQSLRPRQATRLAGAWRRDRGTFQGLVYMNPSARPLPPPPPPPPIDPNGKPPCGDAYGMRTAGGSMCGVCSRLTDCPFTDPGATAGTTLKGGACPRPSAAGKI